MKILVLTSVYPQPDEGDSTPTVEYFCKEWKKQGHEVVVIHNSSRFIKLLYRVPKKICEIAETKLHHPMPNNSTALPLIRVDNGVKIYRLPMLKLFPYGKFPKAIIKKQFNKIIELLEKEHFAPELIISHWVNPQIELLPLLGDKYDAKTSLVFHNDCTNKNIEKFNLIEKIKSVDAIGCRNSSYANKVYKDLKLSKQPFICYSGVPDSIVKDNKFGTHKPDNYIYVGRLIGYKNVDAIIKALYGAYKEKDFVLNIIGEGYDKKKLIELASSLQIADKIRFFGKKDRGFVFDLLSESDVFIMISDNETFGMVYIEAMLRGCITIGSYRGGIDGVIVDGENGFLCEQGDYKELAKLITSIRKMTQEEKKRLREAAIKTACEYSDSNVARRYLEDVMKW